MGKTFILPTTAAILSQSIATIDLYKHNENSIPRQLQVANDNLITRGNKNNCSKKMKNINKNIKIKTQNK